MEERERAIQDKKDRLKRALDNNTVLDGDLRRDAIELAKKAKWDDEGPQKAEAEGDGGGGGGFFEGLAKMFGGKEKDD